MTLRLALGLIALAAASPAWLSGCRDAAAPATRRPPVAPAVRTDRADTPQGTPEVRPPLRPIPPQAAVEVIDLGTGRALFTQKPEVLERPTWLASIAKVFTLRAALDAGVVDRDTRIPCDGRVTLGRRTLQCVHPRMARPLSAVEALAYSCNAFFTSLRVPQGALDAAFRGAGLPPPSPTLAEPRLAWLGLAGTRVAPRRALRAFVSVVEAARRRGSAGDALLLDGLREAATSGTAGAFAVEGVDALAKTGTASLGDGTYGGIVVAVSPASAPRYAVVALGVGIAGRDAAEIAAIALRRVGDGGVRDDEAPPHTAAGRPNVAGKRLVELGRATAAGYRVEVLPLDEYVAGVVAAEAGPAAGTAAREALAVAARSYALAAGRRHASDGFDLCDLTHCQAYRVPDEASRSATRASANLVVQAGGMTVPAFHHASCGGALESARGVWGGDNVPRGVMEARPDPAGPGHEDPWREEIRAAELLEVLRAGGHRGDEVRGLAVARRSASGRVVALRADGLVPTDVDGERFRTSVGRALGWHVLKSSLYDVTRSARGYVFTGRGRGHGVGLCMAGAVRLAQQGHDARRILETYFPGATLLPLPAPEARWPRVVLPDAEESERGAVEALVRRHADAVSRAAGSALPLGAVVRFHESVDGYQRAAGQPWWTSGATREREVHLLPLGVLRRRGLLDRTVRHELAHLVTATALEGRPRWVQEGVARHVAGERLPGAPTRPTCPADEAFDTARSAAELARLYDRALACVERALARPGVDWRVLRDEPS